MSLRDRLTLILHQVFENTDLWISQETILRDLPGWDSIRQVQMIVSTEKEFSVHFTLLQLRDLETVGQLEEMIRKCGTVVEH